MTGSLEVRGIGEQAPLTPGRALVSLVARSAVFVAAQVALYEALWVALGLDLLAYISLTALAVVEVVYIVGSTVLDPQPDYNDVGIGQGLLDQPLSYGDTSNPVLLFLAITFDLIGGPGRWVGVPAVQLFSAILHTAGRPAPRSATPPPAGPAPRPIERGSERFAPRRGGKRR